jgi:hypothetical protein
MRKGSSWMVMVAVALTGASIGVMAQQKDPLTLRERKDLTGPEFSTPPTPAPQELRNLMRANQRIIAVDNLGENAAAGAAAAGGAPAGVTVFGGTLGKSLGVAAGKEDYETVIKDVTTLKENYVKLEAFFADRNSTEGVELARNGQKALADLETAAKEKNKVNAVKAEIALSVTCRNCHIGHRVLYITMPIQFGVVG